MGQLADAIRSTQRAGCIVAEIAAELSPEDAADLADVLADAKIPHVKISDYLTLNVREVGKDSISKHRAGRCRCGRDR